MILLLIILFMLVFGTPIAYLFFAFAYVELFEPEQPFEVYADLAELEELEKYRTE